MKKCLNEINLLFRPYQTMSFNDESVVFRMATEAHYPEVLKVLSENFFIDEPMNVCLRKTESRDVNVFSERMRKYLLPKNMTLLAIDKATNEILGKRSITL